MPNLIYSAPKCVKGQQNGKIGPERGPNHKIDNNSLNMPIGSLQIV